MTEDQLKKRIKNQRIALSMLEDEKIWRLVNLINSINELKRLDDLVAFCQTGKYPE